MVLVPFDAQRLALAKKLIPWTLFGAALVNFTYITISTLYQPSLDMAGFRPAQTLISVYYMLHEGAWIKNIVPVFGEPWIITQEFPFYQWCVALLATITGAPIDVSGRLVSALFAVAVLWPISLIAAEVQPANKWRITLLVGTLWLFAPIVVFWGRTTMIETTAVFMSMMWLAFYIRFLRRHDKSDWIVMLPFGVLAAVIKMPAFFSFLVVGFFFTCRQVWESRSNLAGLRIVLAAAGGSVAIDIVALLLWSRFTDQLLSENPLTAVLRMSSIPTWYFGSWSDRWSAELWKNTIFLRELPVVLGTFWYVVLVGLIGLRSKREVVFSSLLAAAFIFAYLAFPRLFMKNEYYVLENAILLCAIATIVINEWANRDHFVIAYCLLTAVIVGQVIGFYRGPGRTLKNDLHKHPYYLAANALRQSTSPDSVFVGFGLSWRADVALYSERKGIMVANEWPIDKVKQVLFAEREKWLGGRKIGAVVDCAVFSPIAARLIPVRDALVKEYSLIKTVNVGVLSTAGMQPPKCDVYLPGPEKK